MNAESKAQPTGVDKPKAAPKSARRRARELALQGLYEWLLSKDSANQNGGAIDAHVRETAGFDRADAAHFDTLLHGVMKDPERLRAIISPHLDRPMSELSPIEHAVLLIGTFELVSLVEIPYRVVINEAVELAKSFGGTDGFRYVNGVLDKVAIDIRPAEVSAPRRR